MTRTSTKKQLPVVLGIGKSVNISTFFCVKSSQYEVFYKVVSTLK